MLTDKELSVKLFRKFVSDIKEGNENKEYVENFIYVVLKKAGYPETADTFKFINTERGKKCAEDIVERDKQLEKDLGF